MVGEGEGEKRRLDEDETEVEDEIVGEGTGAFSVQSVQRSPSKVKSLLFLSFTKRGGFAARATYERNLDPLSARYF